MKFKISGAAAFAAIKLSTFENRPLHRSSLRTGRFLAPPKEKIHSMRA